MTHDKLTTLFLLNSKLHLLGLVKVILWKSLVWVHCWKVQWGLLKGRQMYALFKNNFSIAELYVQELH